MLNAEVLRPKNTEATALGAAYLAGLAIGFWESTDDIVNNANIDKIYEPCSNDGKREKRYEVWKKAVSKAQSWEEE